MQYVNVKGGKRFSYDRGVVINTNGNVEVVIRNRSSNGQEFLYEPHKSDNPITFFSYHWMYDAL